jgi:ADP-ribose pyrophosphatase YjhB (NUDIX family)
MSAEEKGYSLIADVALFSEGEVLLVKYSDPEGFEGQTGWFIPDSSIKYLEHPDKAAHRLLQDQLALENVHSHLDHIESFRGNDGSWHLTFHYKAVLGGKPKIEPNMDIGQAQWFKFENLPAKDEVAHHGWALTTLNKMQHKE